MNGAMIFPLSLANSPVNIFEMLDMRIRRGSGRHFVQASSFSQALELLHRILGCDDLLDRRCRDAYPANALDHLAPQLFAPALFAAGLNFAAR